MTEDALKGASGEMTDEIAASKSGDGDEKISAYAVSNLNRLETPIWLCKACWTAKYTGGHEWQPTGLLPPACCNECGKQEKLYYIWRKPQEIPKTKQEKESRQAASDAYKLAEQLEETLLNPAGITIENPNEGGQWVYRVVLTRKGDALPNRYQATMKALQLLEKLKKGGLIL